MSISMKTGLRQSQNLVMTPSLKQSIELLALSTIELNERISQELLDNPLLEEGYTAENISSENASSAEDDIRQNLSGDESLLTRTDVEKFQSGSLSDTGYTRTGDDDRKREYLEKVVAQKESLNQHLLDQARVSAGDRDEKELLQNIITSLDDNGFLSHSLSDVASANGVSIPRLKKALAKIQFFEPVGCAVRGVQESLEVQCRYHFPEDKLLHVLIKDYFSDFQNLNYEEIAEKMHISTKEVLEKSRLVQICDPFPGQSYSIMNIRYIYPDIEVRLIDGEIIVTLNDDWIPPLSVNNYYVNMMKKKSIEKKSREYIQDKLNSARYLIKNIQNRRGTILKVVQAIMEYQRDFLERGQGHLKPLTHANIAEIIDMHESTVSRVTTNKAVQTSRGIFQLKSFFVSKIKSEIDEDTSSDQVKSLIRDIITHENSQRPHSDDEIAAILRKAGVTVARRTIAKYRGILNIPTANKRKKLNMIKSEECQ